MFFGVAVWIGFQDMITEGVFQWTDGSPTAYTNWRPNEPNNFLGNENCAEFRRDIGWNDNNCDNVFTSLCEIEFPLSPINTCPWKTED